MYVYVRIQKRSNDDFRIAIKYDGENMLFFSTIKNRIR